MNSLDNLTEINKVSKTIRFEMIPNKDTKDYLCIHMKNDFIRDENKKKAKEELDSEYRSFIKRTLKDADIDFEELGNCILEGDTEKIKKCQKKYREKIVDLFEADEEYKILFKNEKIVSKILSENQGKNLGLEVFKKFTTYFSPFMENRKNIFSSEEKTTSLAYRAININFTDFIYNKMIFDDAAKNNKEVIDSIAKNLSDHGVIQDEKSIYEVFEINSYNKYLLQDGIKLLNSIIGGVVINEKCKIKGFNQLAKEYNDSNRDKKKIALMKKIKKQILSDEINDNFKYESIENEKELLNMNNEFLLKIEKGKILDEFENVIKNIENYDIKKIYISDMLIRKISYRLFGDYRYIKDSMKQEACMEYMEKYNVEKIKQKEEKKINELISWKESDSDVMSTQKEEYIPLEIIKKYTKGVKFIERNGENKASDFIEYFKIYACNLVDSAKEKIEKYAKIYSELKTTNIMDENNIDTIKKVLDSVIGVVKLVKQLYPENIIDVDKEFYYKISKVNDEISDIEKVYNKTRNFVTKAEFSNDKVKLNFDYPTFASGWSKTKEKDNGAILLRKNGKYYIGILNHFNKVSLDKYILDDDEKKDCYEKMNYMVFKDPSRMFPKCIFTKGVKKHFKENDSDYELNTDVFLEKLVVEKKFYETYNKKKFQKKFLDENPRKKAEYNEALRIVIDGYKNFLKRYKSLQVFDFSSLKPTEEYKSIDEFYSDFSKRAYDISFVKISVDDIDSLVGEGKILLFEIYCKDFSDSRTGKKNLHTMYFESLFSEENSDEYILRMSGNAEVFFRRKSIDTPLIHNKGTKIITKTYRENGVEKSIPGELIPILNKVINGGKLSKEENEKYDKETINYYISNATNIKELKMDIVKNRRYTMDKFFLHLPITFNSEVRMKSLNGEIEKIIKSKQHNIIGIDRGERNLLYITVINPEGDILLQKSMNIIEQKSEKRVRVVDFHKKLDMEEKRRDTARKSWKKIGKIRNFKEGYLSLVVHEICKLVLEYDAFLVMENLNAGFKRNRNKFEKQVYQKFEKMLCNKMNYLTFKDRKITDAGGILNGYQFTGEYKENQTRNGIIFYVPAGYTSNIDPTTGFTNPIKLGTIKTLEEKQKIISSMDSIVYSKKENLFSYNIDIDKIENSKVINMFRKKWEINTVGSRIVYNRKIKGYEEKEITKMLTDELEKNGIEFEDGVNLKDTILANKKLVNVFYYGYCLSVQMRNSKKDTDIDYIISPVRNENNEFYDSRNVGGSLPQNADANGAYNIARKGNYMINEKYSAELKKAKVDYKSLFVSNKEWFEYSQKNNKNKH